MDHALYIEELCAAVHAHYEYLCEEDVISENEIISKNEVLKRFFKWWLLGDQFPSNSDATKGPYCELRFGRKAPNCEDMTRRGTPESMIYGLNRYSLLGHLRDEGFLPADRDWVVTLREVGKANGTLDQICEEIVRLIKSDKLNDGYEEFLGKLTISTGLAIRFLLIENIPIPQPIRQEILPFIKPLNTSGKKTGSETQKGYSNDALDCLISSGLYELSKKGVSTAAHLIFWIFRPDIRPDSIATNIRGHHAELLRRKNKQ